MKLLLPFLLLAAPGVNVATSGAAETLTIELPGEILRMAPAHDPAGRPGLALLVALGQAKSLWFLDPAAHAVEQLAFGLHEEVSALTAFDLDGDGRATPVLGMPGVLFAPDGKGGVTRVFAEAHADLLSVLPRSPFSATLPWIPIAKSGRAALLAADGNGGLVRIRTFDLPQTAERSRWGLRLTSPPVSLLAREGPGEPPLIAAGPEPVGKRRLKSLLFGPAGSDPIEAWSLLPADEQLLPDWAYLDFGGRPALAVATLERLGIFAKKRLRMFFLERDRTRKGRLPVFAFATGCALWQRLDLAAVDANRDGRRDLVLVHPSGLRGKDLEVLVFERLEGRFAPRPRRASVSVEAQDFRFGADLTGDGVPDLAVLADGKASAYAGEPMGKVLASRPLWSVAVAGLAKKEGSGARKDDDFDPEIVEDRSLAVFDLDGDGRAEVVVRGEPMGGKTAVTVIRTRRPG